jgi:hypothetical protein
MPADGKAGTSETLEAVLTMRGGSIKNRRGFDQVSWWLFPGSVSDGTILEFLRGEGYCPSGFSEEVVSAFRAWKQVEPAKFRRTKTRVLVIQKARVYR